MKLKFNVTGMTCAACSARVEKVTKAVSGVEFVHNFARLMNDFNLVGAREYAGTAKGEAAAMAVEILDIDEDMGSRLESIIYAKADRIIDSFEKNIIKDMSAQEVETLKKLKHKKNKSMTKNDIFFFILLLCLKN